MRSIVYTFFVVVIAFLMATPVTSADDFVTSNPDRSAIDQKIRELDRLEFELYDRRILSIFGVKPFRLSLSMDTKSPDGYAYRIQSIHIRKNLENKMWDSWE